MITLEGFLQYILANQNIFGVLALGLSAMIEYVFPPFPGDTVTVLGAVLVGTGNLEFFSVLFVLTAGSVAGAGIDFGIGHLVARRRSRNRAVGKPAGRIGRQVDKVVVRFRKHGEIYILLNRFLPGIRGVFFYAAALARMRFSRVMLFAALSAMAWNLLLMLGGIAIGANFDTLLAIFKQYSIAAWSLLAVAGLVLAVRWAWRTLRGAKDEDDETPGPAPDPAPDPTVDPTVDPPVVPSVDPSADPTANDSSEA